MGTSGGEIDDAQLDAYIRLIDDAAYVEITKSLDVAAGLRRLLDEVDSGQAGGGSDLSGGLPQANEPIMRDEM